MRTESPFPRPLDIYQLRWSIGSVETCEESKAMLAADGGSPITSAREITPRAIERFIRSNAA